jgi:hypothetical protein
MHHYIHQEGHPCWEGVILDIMTYKNFLKLNLFFSDSSNYNKISFLDHIDAILFSDEQQIRSQEFNTIRKEFNTICKLFGMHQGTLMCPACM